MGKVRESLKLKKTLWEAADIFWAFRSSWPWAFYSLKNLFCIEWNVSVLCLLATVVGWWVHGWSHLFACRTLKQGSQVGCAHHCVLGTTFHAARQPQDISLCVCTFVHDLIICKGWMIRICPPPPGVLRFADAKCMFHAHSFPRSSCSCDDADKGGYSLESRS